MTAETLAIALVVLVGATVVSMIKEFFTRPWHLEVGTIYIEDRAYQPVPVPAPQALPVAMPTQQPRLLAPLQPLRLEAPEPAVLAAD